MGTTTLEQTALPNQEILDVTSVDFLRYAGSPGGQEFHHYRVNGGGHEWFGVWGSPDVDATAVLWDFFSAQCAGAFTDVPVLEDTAKWVDHRKRWRPKPSTVRGGGFQCPGTAQRLIPTECGRMLEARGCRNDRAPDHRRGRPGADGEMDALNQAGLRTICRWPSAPRAQRS